MRDRLNLIPIEERAEHAREITRRFMPARKRGRFGGPLALALLIHVIVLGGGLFAADHYVKKFTRPAARPTGRSTMPPSGLIAPGMVGVFVSNEEATGVASIEVTSPAWTETPHADLEPIAPLVAPTRLWPTSDMRRP